MSSPRWTKSHDPNSVEFSLSDHEAAVLLLSQHPLKVGAALCKMDKTHADWIKRANLVELKQWLNESGIARDEIQAIRVLGSPEQISEIKKSLETLSLTFGPDVTLTESRGDFQLLPHENRLRRAILQPSSDGSKFVKGTPIEKKRVLIVDDSETIQKLLSRVLETDPHLTVVGVVGLPSQVEKAIQELKPDVLTLDIHMPEMNGVELLKKVLPKFRIPTVMISSLSKEEGTYVLDALEAGAIDYIQKPSMADLSHVAPQIREKVRSAAHAKVSIKSERRPLQSSKLISVSAHELDPTALILIGSSTGGTEALREVLTRLPSQIPPILIVQHIPAVFSLALAKRLNDLCPFLVKEAENGDPISPNQVLIAPGGFQMRVVGSGSDLSVVVEDTPPVNRHKPSVDVLFDSAVGIRKRKLIAAILTGMGADGAKGLLRLKQSGAKTIGQDEASCVVYGMPREAALIGAVEQVLPLEEIAQGLLNFSRKKSSNAA